MILQQERKWNRPNAGSGQVIILDGLTGTGKTMLMRLIDTLPNLSAPRFDYQLEQLCIAISENKLELNAGIQLLQLLFDQRQYDLKIAREVNFRPSDLSSVLNSTKKFDYIKSLLRSDENVSLQKKDAIFFVVHQLLLATKCFDHITSREFKKILAVRHPYYLFDHWVSYVGAHGASPRDFTITVGKECAFPWFVKENADLYCKGSTENKAAVAISELINEQEMYLKSEPNIFVVDFEKFVLEPSGFLTDLSQFMELSFKDISRVLRKEKLPRTHINDSKHLKVYHRYNSNLLTNQYNHKEDYSKLRKRLSETLSRPFFNMLESAAWTYEDRFGLWF